MGEGWGGGRDINSKKRMPLPGLERGLLNRQHGTVKDGHEKAPLVVQAGLIFVRAFMG